MRKLLSIAIMMALVLALTMTGWADDTIASSETSEPIQTPGVEESTAPEGPALDGTPEEEKPVTDPEETAESTEGTEVISEEDIHLDGEQEETVDPTETMEQIYATLPTSLPDSWSEAALAVAKSQIGYEPVQTETIPYNRYIYWSGEDYDVSPAFIFFCIYYAGIPSGQFTTYKTVEAWNEHAELIHEDGGLFLGDLVFLDLDVADNIPVLDDNGEVVLDEAELPIVIPVADHIGIVSWTDDSLWVITATTSVVEIQVSAEQVLAYQKLPVKPEPVQEEAEPATDGDAEEETPVPYVLDNHVFCPDGYRLFLLPEGDLPAEQTYFVNGIPLYYDPIDGVFYAFVVFDEAITLEAIEAERLFLAQDYDINSDGILNIADANAIYQMVQNGGSYYSVDQISLEARLRVDYHSIINIDEIINRINGVA